MGYLGVLAGFLILGYYSVVAGWTLEYILEAGMNGFADKKPEDFVVAFQSFSKDPVRPLIWLVIFYWPPICYSKGSERWNREIFEGADACFVCTDSSFGGVLIVASQCGKGLEFLLKPDFSKVNGDVFLGAMGQAFFSLSLGMGCLSTYASYFGKETKLGNTALSVGVIDTFVAVLAGLIIFRRPFL